jgi:hypothetical protein
VSLEKLVKNYKRKPAQLVYEDGDTTPESDKRETYEAFEDGSGPSDKDIAADVEKSQETYISDLIKDGFTKEQAEQLAEKEYGFKPGVKMEVPEVPDVMPEPIQTAEMMPKKIQSEDIDRRYSEIFDIIGRGYQRLQKEGRIGE